VLLDKKKTVCRPEERKKIEAKLSVEPPSFTTAAEEEERRKGLQRSLSR